MVLFFPDQPLKEVGTQGKSDHHKDHRTCGSLARFQTQTPKLDFAGYIGAHQQGQGRVGDKGVLDSKAKPVEGALDILFLNLAEGVGKTKPEEAPIDFKVKEKLQMV